MSRKQLLRLSAAAVAAGSLGVQPARAQEAVKIAHVLLISVDGLHEVDVNNYVALHPGSGFARLRQHGVSYTHAATSKPSDSFPGLTALVTGASPRTAGVYYDDSYDRTLSPPLNLLAAGVKPCSSAGSETQYAENIDKSYDSVVLGGSTRLDGGGDSGVSSINPAALPRDPAHGCKPVYPHEFLRVNTIFNVAHDAGLYTAWSDKHPAYDLVRGPANTGAEDFYAPEINSPPHDLACTLREGPGGNVDDRCPIIDINAQWTSDFSYINVYDGLKVQAVINEINGYDHTGRKQVGVPAILGMNFQAVSVGEKLTAGGYVDAKGTPSPVLNITLDFVDASLTRILDALEAQHLDKETLVIVGAKHGQSPIDVTKLHMLVGSKNPKAVADVTDVQDVLNAAGAPVAHAVEDDVSLDWLVNNATDVATGVAALRADKTAIRAQTIYSGGSLAALFGSPVKDPRVPDIVVQPIPGTIYSKSSGKIAEHGGLSADDRHTALIVSNPRLPATKVTDPVTNYQVAPTILMALGLDYTKLDSYALEGTQPLPGLPLAD